MTAEELVRHLREAGTDEVEAAVRNSKVSLPLTTDHEALEFFHCMLDVLTGVRAEEDAAEEDRIKPGFGSTH